MGNNKSTDSNTRSSETTLIENLKNTSVHFDNIYNFNEQHTQKVMELHKKVDILTTIFLSICICVVVFFVAKKLLKICKTKRDHKIEARAQALAIDMIEKGVVLKK